MAKYPLIVSLSLLLLNGCSAPRDVVEVTSRPDVERTEIPDKPEPPAAPPMAEAAAGAASFAVSRFDGGKMWTFENPPVDYFESEYGFRPAPEWFEKARLGALRFSTYCSASFVSPNGLVLTNHHCGRQSITDVEKPGEDLLENGFYATAGVDERQVPDLYVDQLIGIEDVTSEIYANLDEDASNTEKHTLRTSKAEALEKSRTSERQKADSTIVVEVISHYSGARYSAYTFKRYKDVRLVMAPELDLGFFGGDPDNFTYPRYSLDMSFFRVYGDDGNPVKSDNYFRFSTDALEEGDAVFVVGNPGQTSRLSTVSQLEFERDFTLPAALRVMRSRAEILGTYIDAHPDSADLYDLRNTYFSISNSIKATEGQLKGLESGEVIPRRAAAETIIRKGIAADSSLAEEYGNLFRDLSEIQATKKAVVDQSGAFTNFSTESMTSHVLLRGLYGYVHDIYKQRGAPPEAIKELRDEADKIESWPSSIEREYIRARLDELVSHLGPEHPGVDAILTGRTPEQVANDIVDNTALLDSLSFQKMLNDGYQAAKDVSYPIVETLATLFFNLGQQMTGFDETEQALNAQLARAQFQIVGETSPPDASFSLRISDGRVMGYQYNGTSAPPFTTFFGLYDRHSSFHSRDEWELPEKWENAGPEFDRRTPFNAVSTNDITGGNSGSPLLDKDLNLVGLIFDSNINALPNEYVYSDEQARAISVAASGILEVLDDIYDADRIRIELVTGRFYGSESEADATDG